MQFFNLLAQISNAEFQSDGYTKTKLGKFSEKEYFLPNDMKM